MTKILTLGEAEEAGTSLVGNIKVGKEEVQLLGQAISLSDSEENKNEDKENKGNKNYDKESEDKENDDNENEDNEEELLRRAIALSMEAWIWSCERQSLSVW